MIRLLTIAFIVVLAGLTPASARPKNETPAAFLNRMAQEREDWNNNPQVQRILDGVALWSRDEVCARTMPDDADCSRREHDLSDEVVGMMWMASHDWYSELVEGGLDPVEKACVGTERVLASVMVKCIGDVIDQHRVESSPFAWLTLIEYVASRQALEN